jgi:hypothetical protein
MMRMSFAMSEIGASNKCKIHTCDHGVSSMNLTFGYVRSNPFTDFEVCLFRLFRGCYLPCSDGPHRLCEDINTVISETKLDNVGALVGMSSGFLVYDSYDKHCCTYHTR